MIMHHPGEDVIGAYAAGTLHEAHALAIATHLTLCPQCRREFGAYEALGGTLIEDTAELSMAPDAFASTMARVHKEGSVSRSVDIAPAQARNTASTPLLPTPLRQYVGGDIDLARWRLIGSGIHQMPLIARDGATARLLRIAPGATVFDHSHTGSELTVVLQGSYRSQGQHFARGDLETADDSVQHHPIAGMDDVCICLAVTEAPLRFSNWVGRLLQPFIGV